MIVRGVMQDVDDVARAVTHDRGCFDCSNGLGCIFLPVSADAKVEDDVAVFMRD